MMKTQHRGSQLGWKIPCKAKLDDGYRSCLRPEVINIDFDNRTIHIDAAILALDLGIAVSTAQGLMRSGEITSLCERGVDSDEGRLRLTFFHQNRRLRLIVDDAGNIIQCSAIDFGDRQLPAAMHRPNA